MFRKPLPVTGTHKLGGSDVKRLKKELAKKLRLDPDDAEAIVGGKKSVLELVKSPAPSRVQIYLSDGAPVVIDHSGKGDYELTYFALWRAPGALGEPVVLRHCAVTRYLVRGADLMLPGVGRVPSTAVPFGVGKLFAVTVPGNPTPLAVGETCVGSAEFDPVESSGKFLRIRSCYRDALWAMAAAHPARPPLLPNEGFLERGVVGVSAEDSEHDAGLALDEDERDEEDGGGEGGGGGGGGGGVALPPNALVETSAIETSAVETSAVETSTDAHETADAMDARIDAAFAYAIARRVKNADLPAPSSSFWGRHVAPSRAAGAPPLEVRRSSHKKMSRVFAAFAKRGWLTGKEDPRTKEFVVTSVRRTHADLERFLPNAAAPFETAGDAEARERSASERDADTRASLYTGAAAAAFAASSSTSSPPLVLERKLRVPASALGVFRALAEARGPERFPFSPDTLYTREGAAAVAEAYCDLADLTKGESNPTHITLDTVLCDALFEGVLKKGEPYPTRLKRRDALGETWLSRFHPVTFVSRGARSATKKGDLAPVRVESERRGGDRKVTRVVGFETYLIEPEELRETLARTLATNCQVADLEATKNRAPGAKAIVAAGNAVEKTRVTLREHYGVPDSCIVTKDVFNGKGKNK